MWKSKRDLSVHCIIKVVRVLHLLISSFGKMKNCYTFCEKCYGLGKLWLHIAGKLLRIYNGSNEEV